MRANRVWHGGCSADAVMQKAIAMGLRCALLFSVPVTAACGDSDDGELSPAVVSPAARDGADVHLLRDSTRCSAPAPTHLVAKMGAGVEFSEDNAQPLASPCLDDANPGIEVDIEHGSVLFDFSNVATEGRFPDAVFEGYVLYFARKCGDPIFTSATLDREVSNVDVRSGDISTHFDRLKVNFAGIAYDQTSFLKIDLSWANVNCLAEER